MQVGQGGIGTGGVHMQVDLHKLIVGWGFRYLTAVVYLVIGYAFLYVAKTIYTALWG